MFSMTSKKLWTQDNFSLFILAILVYSFASYSRWGGALADDGAFFLQYAKNMAEGGFWVWNLGEAPIWGSSAPLFPLFIAPLLKLGIDPINAILAVSMIIGILSFSLLFITIKHKFGTLSSIIFIILTSLDSHLIWFGTNAGLETPLTFLLLTLGVMTILLAPEKSLFIGLIAGLLCVQKLDLLPAAAGLILAQIFYLKRISFLTILIAFVVAIIWYGFAWVYFGLPLPNSFITKALYQDQVVVNTREWFSTFVWIKDSHIFMTGSLLITLFLFRKKIEWPLWIFLGVLAISHTIAYTIKFPFEPYDWYCMPSLFSLIILGSISSAFIIEKISLIVQQKRVLAIFTYLILVYLFIVPTIQNSINVTNSIKHYLNLEKDRENAGRWVSENTPRNFKVFTYWGNPAFFSNRYEYDGSFLNMHFIDKNIIETYKPEVVIVDDKSPNGYILVKIFDQASNVGINYPFGVHIRSDLVNQVTDIDPNPIANRKDFHVKDYINNKKLGDVYGNIQEISSKKLFLHPGATTPTSFSFDSKKFFEQTAYKSLVIEIMISPELPLTNIQRGAGVVNVQYTHNNGLITNQDVTSSKHMKIEINDFNSTDKFNISVDPKLNADSDWVWIKFYGSK
jgi:hypothetical protein